MLNAPPPVRVRTDGVEQTAYLFKVPEDVFRRCLEAQPGEPIGEVELGPASGAMPVRLHLDGETTAAGEEVPASTFEVRAQPPQAAAIYAYTEQLSSGAIALSATARPGMLQASMTEERRKFLQKRKEQAQAPKRTMQAFDGEAAKTLTKKQAIVTATRDIRQKLEPEVLKRKLLSLFTLEREYWSLKELEAETGQPTDHLKGVLLEVCTYNDTGEHRAKWQLNAKYRG
jgi:ribosomal protein L9